MSKIIDIDIKETLQYIKDGDVNPKRIMSICFDIFPEHKRELNFLSLAVKFGIADKIRNTKNIDSIKANNIIRELTDDYAIQENVAKEVVGIWLSVYAPAVNLIKNEVTLTEVNAKEILKTANDNFSNIETKENILRWRYSKNGIEITGVYNKKIKTIVIPSNFNGKPVLYIGNAAFKDCHDLKEVVIPNTVTSIGKYAFNSCWNITEIDIPDSVAIIEDEAFAGCNLKKVILPNTLTSIGKGAFGGNRELKNIIIPNSVENIDAGAFILCGLSKITLPARYKRSKLSMNIRRHNCGHSCKIVYY